MPSHLPIFLTTPKGNEGVLRPIALATADPALGQWARVSGFGNQNIKPFGQPEYGLGELRAVDVKVEACSGSLSWASQSSICTDNKGRQGQAAWGGKGDSGGPLVYKNQLVGVVQSIRGDGKGIYISVTKHREFIQSALQDRQVGANSGFVPSERGGTSNGPASGTARGRQMTVNTADKHLAPTAQQVGRQMTVDTEDKHLPRERITMALAFNVQSGALQQKITNLA